MLDSENTWNDNNIQFPRLLAEIRAVGLTLEQMTQLSVSMDLAPEDILVLLERAEEQWEAVKDKRR